MNFARAPSTHRSDASRHTSVRELCYSLDRETDEGVEEASAKSIDQSSRSINHSGECKIP